MIIYGSKSERWSVKIFIRFKSWEAALKECREESEPPKRMTGKRPLEEAICLSNLLVRSDLGRCFPKMSLNAIGKPERLRLRYVSYLLESCGKEHLF